MLVLTPSLHRGRHESELNAAVHTKFAGGQHAISDATVDCLRFSEAAELDYRAADGMECRDVVVAPAQLLELFLRTLLAQHGSIVAVHRARVPQHCIVLEVHWTSVQPRRVELLVTQRRLVELTQLLVAQVE